MTEERVIELLERIALAQERIAEMLEAQAMQRHGEEGERETTWDAAKELAELEGSRR